MLPTTDRREFAAAGVVLVGAPPGFIVDRFRDIDDFKQSDLVLHVQRVSTPPRLEDFKALVLDEDDVDDLRSCRPRSCGLRLTDRQIARFQSMDWKARTAPETAAGLMRDVLKEEATAYLTFGAAGLGPYGDKRAPLDRRLTVATLLERTPSLTEPFPEFREYLRAFPAAGLAPMESFLYWSREKFGFRPVISLTHVAIYRPQGHPSVNAVIASRQVFATYYFDASVGITALATSPDVGQVLMMYLNRTQTSSLGGLFSSVARSIARSRTRRGLEEQLGHTRTRLEAGYRKGG
jgi:hypothetical protein